jgi:hypothetical protein
LTRMIWARTCVRGVLREELERGYWQRSRKKGAKRVTERSSDTEPPFNVEDGWILGWDFTLVFDDEVVGGLDWKELDHLSGNLAASEGISEVLHEDREVFHLKVDDLDASAVQEKAAEAVERVGIRYD